jgi:hypothetical protein
MTSGLLLESKPDEATRVRSKNRHTQGVYLIDEAAEDCLMMRRNTGNESAE